MPTYGYECRKCGHQFDAFQKMTDAPLKRCPKCKKDAVRRLISGGAGLLFKGSGFYITDYRSDGYKSKAKADTTSTAAPAAAPAKPEKKAAAGKKEH